MVVGVLRFAIGIRLDWPHAPECFIEVLHIVFITFVSVKAAQEVFLATVLFNDCRRLIFNFDGIEFARFCTSVLNATIHVIVRGEATHIYHVNADKVKRE